MNSVFWCWRNTVCVDAGESLLFLGKWCGIRTEV